MIVLGVSVCTAVICVLTLVCRCTQGTPGIMVATMPGLGPTQLTSLGAAGLGHQTQFGTHLARGYPPGPPGVATRASGDVAALALTLSPDFVA